MTKTICLKNKNKMATYNNNNNNKKDKGILLNAQQD